MAASTMTFSAAQARVAETAGASGFTAETTRAGYAITQALEIWNASHNWDYLLTEGAGFNVVAPFTITGVGWDTVSAQFTLGVSGEFANILAGDVPLDTTVNGTTVPKGLMFTQNGAASATAVSTTRVALASAAAESVRIVRPYFALPSDFNSLYNARLLSDPRVLLPMTDRDYDMIDPWDEPTTTTHYAVSKASPYRTVTSFAAGYIRLVPTPVAADTLMIKYYRKMALPSASGDLLDLPDSYEFAVLSLAKGIYLTEKGDPEKAQFHWAIGQEGLRRAIGDDARQPDDDEGFLPGAVRKMPTNPNSVWPYLQEP